MHVRLQRSQHIMQVSLCMSGYEGHSTLCRLVCVCQATKATWAGDLARRSTPTGNYSKPSVLANTLSKYIKDD